VDSAWKLRFYVDGYHLNLEGIPVLVDAIHKTGVLEEQTEPHLILSDSGLLGFTGQDVGSLRTFLHLLA